MKSLQNVIDTENSIARMFNPKAAQLETLQLSGAQAQVLFERLDCNLSPEVLHADGERSRAAAAKLAKTYKQAWDELKSLGFVPQGKFYNIEA
jgi:hypothetical protein